MVPAIVTVNVVTIINSLEWFVSRVDPDMEFHHGLARSRVATVWTQVGLLGAMHFLKHSNTSVRPHKG